MQAYLWLLNPQGEIIAEGVPEYDPGRDAVAFEGKAKCDGHLAVWRLRVDAEQLEGPLAAGGVRVLRGQAIDYHITARDLLHAERAAQARSRKARERVH